MVRRVHEAARAVIDVGRDAAAASSHHSVTMMASSMAYWLLLTLAPFALLLNVTAQLLAEAGATAVLEPAFAVGEIAEDAAALAATAGGWPTFATLLVVVYSASSFFAQFALALSRIWGIPDEHGALWQFARRHLLGFLLVCILAIALFASVLVGSVIAAASSELAELADTAGLQTPGVMSFFAGRFGIDMMASAALFLFAFTLVPSRRILMRDVVPGALITGLAYAVGQVALSGYLSTTSRITMAGTLGSLIGVLLWVYYTALIALYGAELTRAIVLRKEAGRGPAGPAVPDGNVS